MDDRGAEHEHTTDSAHPRQLSCARIAKLLVQLQLRWASKHIHMVIHVVQSAAISSNQQHNRASVM